MKRIFSFFLCICLLCSCFASFQIEVIASSEINEELESALSYTCVFHPDTSTVELSGTTNHSTMVSNSNSTLMVYALLPGMEVSDLLTELPEPIAKSDISIKFHFSMKIDNVLGKYSRYAIFLCAPDGSLTLTAEPQYPVIASSSSLEPNKEHYKGISSPLTSFIGSGMMAGTTVIPVSIHDLMNRETNGYLYHHANQPYYFETAYVDALDVKIRAATATGSRVYLQYLLPAHASSMAYADSTGTEAMYELPNVLSESVLQDIEALTGFLLSRYDGGTVGKLNGIIVGKGIDHPELYQYAGPVSAECYVKLYFLYLLAVSNSAHTQDVNCEIVLPFTDSNPTLKIQDPFSASHILELLLQEVENGISSSFAIKTLIEIETVPFGITNENLENGIDLSYEQDNSRLSAVNFKEYSSYLAGLRRKYSFAPSSCMVIWNVPVTLTENALACAYTYSYFRLLSNTVVDSFTIACSDSGAQLSDLRQILTYIDTSDAMTVTKDCLPYFDVNSWSDLLSFDNDAIRNVYTLHAFSSLPDERTGSFVYANYSESVEVENWYKGDHCTKIKSEYHKSFGRAIRMDMRRTEENKEWYGEAFCLYEFEESFAYTPYLAFRLFCDGISAEALYEVHITVGNGSDGLEASYVLHGGKQEQVVLDLHALKQDFYASYLRIRVRQLTEGNGEYAVWLQDITGYSTQYSDEALSDLIRNERLAIRNELQTQEQVEESRYVWIVFTVLFVTGSIVIGIFILLRREESSLDKE